MGETERTIPIPPALFQQLQARAKRRNMTVDQYVAHLLQKPSAIEKVNITLWVPRDVDAIFQVPGVMERQGSYAFHFFECLAASVEEIVAYVKLARDYATYEEYATWMAEQRATHEDFNPYDIPENCYRVGQILASKGFTPAQVQQAETLLRALSAQED